jgi:integrase
MLPQKKYNKEEIESFLSLQINSKIAFDDSIWDFYSEDNELLYHVDKAKARIKWCDYEDVLPKAIIVQIKILAVYYLRRKDLVSYRHEQRIKGFQDWYVCGTITKLLRFFKVIHAKSVLSLGNSIQVKISPIKSLFDVTVGDLQVGVDNFPQSGLNTVPSMLKHLCQPELQEALNFSGKFAGKIQWNQYDIKNMRWPDFSERARKLELDDRYLNSNLVTFLISRSTQLIEQFCNEYSIDDISSTQLKNNKSLRIIDDMALIRKKASDNAARKKRRQFAVDYGITTYEFADRLALVQAAAFYILLQFTGARYSEAIHFKISKLEKLETGFWVIKGNVLKNKQLNYLTDSDYWIVSPICYKAILTLEVLNLVYQSPYLFGTSIKMKPVRVNKPIRNGTLNARLRAFLKQLDSEHKFCDVNGQLLSKDFSITTHKIRHTLARELIRCNLSIAQISYQFKHIFIGHLFFKRPADVTGQYGGVNTTVFNDTFALNKVRGEFLKTLVSGEPQILGQRGSDLKAKIKEFFRGKSESGKEYKAVMDGFLRAGKSFIEIGVGFCFGPKEIVDENGAKHLPTCVGSNKCSSVLCSNSFYTAEKIPALRAMLASYEDVLADKELEHYHELYAPYVRKLKEILSEFLK